jgi:hypothetical protein
MVRFSISEGSIEGGSRVDDVVGHVEGCEVSGLRSGDSEGVWGLEVVRDGVRDGSVWLSLVRRSEVMMTCGTW